MRAVVLLLLLPLGCASVSRTSYGKFVVETHSYDLGSSCLSGSHSHLLGADGQRMLEPLLMWELSGDQLWALAGSGRDRRTIHLLDLYGGRVHSTHDRGEPGPEPWQPPYGPLKWSSDRDYLLLERIDDARTRSLVLFSFRPSLNIRTLHREEGFHASVHELRNTFWAPDGSGLAFLVSPGPLRGPTRLFFVGFDGAAPRQTDEADGPPNSLAVDWSLSPPRLR